MSKHLCEEKTRLKALMDDVDLMESATERSKTFLLMVFNNITFAQ